MLILLDMDGPLVEYHGGFLREFYRQYPDAPYKTLAELTEFYIRDNYPPEWKDRIDSIYYSPEFYFGLRPIPGSIAAVREITRAGHKVKICTNHSSRIREVSIIGKTAWIKLYLGKEFAEKTVFTKDKTRVPGDILVDDKPEIAGQAKPSWEHVVFDRPYNRHAKGKRRITWENYAEILGI